MSARLTPANVGVQRFNSSLVTRHLFRWLSFLEANQLVLSPRISLQVLSIVEWVFGMARVPA
jgi:hypothetical protein